MSTTNAVTRSASQHVRVVAALLAVPLLIGLAACSAPGGPQASGGDSTTGTEQSFEDYQLAYAQCMRDEGIDFPDPEGDGGMSVTLDAGNAEAMTAASDACRDKLGTPPAPPGGTKSEAEVREEMLKMAQCFRDQGFDVPDPKDGQAFGIPADAPEEVFEACGLGAGGGAAVTTQG